MGRPRRIDPSASWRAKELYSREDLKRQGFNVAPFVSYERFRARWNREHKGQETPEPIIREFWGDYITSDAKSLSDYFEEIQK